MKVKIDYKDVFDLVFPKVQNNKEIPLAYTTPSGTNEFFKMWQKIIEDEKSLDKIEKA